MRAFLPQTFSHPDSSPLQTFRPIISPHILRPIHIISIHLAVNTIGIHKVTHYVFILYSYTFSMWINYAVQVQLLKLFIGHTLYVSNRFHHLYSYIHATEIHLLVWLLWNQSINQSITIPIQQ